MTDEGRGRKPEELTLGELVAAIAHELNQPLTAILTNAETTRSILSASRMSPEELDEALKDIIADASRAGEIIQRLRHLARPGELKPARIDLKPDDSRHGATSARRGA